MTPRELNKRIKQGETFYVFGEVNLATAKVEQAKTVTQKGQKAVAVKTSLGWRAVNAVRQWGTNDAITLATEGVMTWALN